MGGGQGQNRGRFEPCTLGTASRHKADVLETSFSPRQPRDYNTDQACASKCTIEKGPGLHGDHAGPFEAQLELTDGKAAWIVKDVDDAVRIRVAALLAAGMSVREIAEEIGATKSAVHRMKQRLERGAREAEGGEEAGQGGGE
jgi:HAMP domain-containing protein